MSYSFNGSTQYLSATPLPVTLGNTFSMSAWFHSSGGANTNRGLISVYSTGNNARCCMKIGSNNLLQAHTQGAVSATRIHSSLTSISLDVWYHGFAVFPNNLLPTIYLNGTIGSTTININLSFGIGTTAEFAIGLERASTSWFNGLIANVAIWNTNTISSNEIISLSQGINPSKIRPQSLVFYSPLIRDFTDIVGGKTISNNNGVTVADHPRIYY